MNREALLYIVICLACLLLAGAILAFMYISRVQKEADAAYALLEEQTRGTEDEEPVTPEEPLVPESSLDPQAVQSDLLDSEQLYMSMLDQIRALYTVPVEEVVEEVAEEAEVVEEVVIPDTVFVYVKIPDEGFRVRMDATIAAMTVKMDSLRSYVNTYMNENIALRFELNQKNLHINDLNSSVESLNGTIEIMNTSVERLKEELQIFSTPVDETIEIDYRQIARIYDGMDSKKVGTLLQQMTPENAVQILKRMNQRKVTKIMADLPTNVSMRYAQLMLLN